MAPRNKKKNSFYFYMKEVQEREAAKGRRIAIGDMANYAHPMWAKMSIAEREPYEELARRHKNDPNLRGGKLASDGTRIEDNLLEIEEQEREENRMKQEIKRFVNSDCISEEQFKEFASRKMFYFISFNILCRTETDYIPIEVGAVEYSIQHGIHREHHTVIHHGRIPTGYAGEAKRMSEDKHEIDIYGADEGSERDLVAVFRSIKSFINPHNSDEYPPLFCVEDELELTRGCLKWLGAKAKDGEIFDVWNATYLLMELRAGVGEALPSTFIASDLLAKTSFNYHPAARCEFHEEKDNHNCALAYSKRLCWLLSDAVCPLFDVMLTERHMPTRCSEEKDYVVTIPNNASRYDRKPVPSSAIRLDHRNNYYQNVEEDQFSDLQASEPEVRTTASVPRQPRQPASSCIAAEMTRLKLQMTAASVPGHGIGRGQRWNN